MRLWDLMKDVYDSVEDRVTNMQPIDIDRIPSTDELKLEVGKWYRVRDVVCVYVDLNDSTRASFQKTKEGMAKVYEHIGTGFVKIFQHENFRADFIDLKGDGGFALYKGNHAEIKAFIAAETFKTYAYKYLRKRFSEIDIRFGIGISKGNLLVKKVGTRKVDDKSWNYPVWAGRVVNHAAYICKAVKGISSEADIIGVSREVFKALSMKEFWNWLIISCGCPNDKKVELWKQNFSEDEDLPGFYYLESNWCERHGDEYINHVIQKIRDAG